MGRFINYIYSRLVEAMAKSDAGESASIRISFTLHDRSRGKRCNPLGEELALVFF